MKRAAALALALLAATATAAPGGADLEAAATQIAQTLGGVLRDCPASFAQIGTPEKQCVGVGDSVEDARLKLNAALPEELYGVWRSRDGQRSVHNWLKTAGGYVYLRLQPDPDGRAQTLIYLDLPPAQSQAAPNDASAAGTVPAGKVPAETPPAEAIQIGGVTLTPAAPATPTPEASARAQTTTSPPADTEASTAAPAAASPDVPDLAPGPFDRTLQVQNRRLNGPDVLAVQSRLIALMRPARAGQGDGWYGPVTAQTVRLFQKANGLPATGVVDHDTWNRLFSERAAPFGAPQTP